MRIHPALVTLVLFGIVADAPHGAAPERSAATAAHVLNRITFGVRAHDLDRIAQTGLEAYIDAQLHPERLSDAEVERRLARFETLRLTSAAIAEQYEIPAVQARRQRQQQQQQGLQPPANQDSQAADAGQPSGRASAPAIDPVRARANLPLLELSEQKILRAVYSERQLQEVLTDFWFNHFNVDARKGPTRYMLTEYERDVIRPHVLGHFRDLLGATAKSPAMLFYLDNWMSSDPDGPSNDRLSPRTGRQRDTTRVTRPGSERRGTAPATGSGRLAQSGTARAQRRPTGLNENYGRELLELHTLGVDGGYTQQDVTEVARAFTGWTIDRPRFGGGFRFAPALHDDGRKVVLGHVIAAGGGQQDGETVLDIVARHPATARFIATKLARRFVHDNPPTPLVDRMVETFRRTNGDLRVVMATLLKSPEFVSADYTNAKVKTPFEFVVSALRVVDADIRSARPIVRAIQELGMPLYQCQPPTGYKDVSDAWVNTGALVSRMNIALHIATGQMPGVRVGSPVSAEAVVPSGMSDATAATIARAQTSEQALALVLGSPEFQRR